MRSRPLFTFYLLVIYIFVQFICWTYHLAELNNEVNRLKTELAEHRVHGHGAAIETRELLDKKLRTRWMMIIGEGSVFLILLVLGILKIRRTFKREAELASLQKNFL